ncbi:imidazole glycerol phosphate synthase subunit HisH [Vibrio tubiashii]|uniref:imidazole glycerol phosphate synthase subunit HisH n=1 Tax=Vibrio tubiashii TaxID=29498 RepID=UPI00349EAC6C
MKIAIVDYGMGNISSLKSALLYVGAEDVIVSKDFNVLCASDKLILPGVGNYALASKKIRQIGLDEVLQDIVVENKKPLLGVCLGMQILGESSTESGFNLGLNFVDGQVTEFSETNLRVPHVGYNQIKVNSNSRLYTGLKDNSDFYFTHSYRMTSNSDIGQSMCDYEDSFIASFEKDNIAGVQFHPELSQKNGLRLLRNFIELF